MPSTPDSYRSELDRITPPPTPPPEEGDGKKRRPRAERADTRPLAERGEELYALWAAYRKRKLAVLREYRKQRRVDVGAGQRPRPSDRGDLKVAATSLLSADPELEHLSRAIAQRW